MFKFWKKNANKNENPDQEVNLEEGLSGEEIQEEISDDAFQDQRIEEVVLQKDVKEEGSQDQDLSEDTLEEDIEEEKAQVEEEEEIENIEDADIQAEEEITEEETIEKEIIEEVDGDGSQDSDQEEGQEKMGIFARLLAGLSKTKDNITGRIDSLLKSYTKIDEDLLEELEEILITADVGVTTTMEIIDRLRDMIKERGVKDPIEVRDLLKEIVASILNEGNSGLDLDPGPAVIVMVGVNGVGKTTTIGKLAQRYKKDGKKVMLAAADTFRAAASEQLDIWAKRVDVDIIKHHEGADPGAVVFDAIKASQARKVDLLICDTAGRLHNKANLMNELGKIFKIIDREYPEAKKEVLLVVDATTGQNAVSQAKTFKEVANITGIVLTKLDGTAKGGVVLAVKSEVDVPVKLIGVGERAEDLQSFDADSFTDAIFG
ncbi:signal recognition particle-docking protein FtsY [Peptostreptococcus stomatis DSM 17678]|uniref:Signal recognition particle receptor FtsY n=1 Tax=Peptostreptococcus stomatis DSM 17678 TaxID=596315 RepID=E0E421_9FIRM|nr:signal recognition particle-docking protein FtsY [Peptostreptococcus stomatis]EFM64477.1 signal recognition particle-docking protein FtsY [Peptostreptococcus stomatis DSM 17678]